MSRSAASSPPTRHAELDGYQTIRARPLTDVAIARLSQPRAAISRILQRRIDGSDVDATVDDVFTQDALTRLVAESDRVARMLVARAFGTESSEENSQSECRYRSPTETGGVKLRAPVRAGRGPSTAAPEGRERPRSGRPGMRGRAAPPNRAALPTSSPSDTRPRGPAASAASTDPAPITAVSVGAEQRQLRRL
jgi:hypothetical protein